MHKANINYFKNQLVKYQDYYDSAKEWEQDEPHKGVAARREMFKYAGHIADTKAALRESEVALKKVEAGEVPAGRVKRAEPFSEVDEFAGDYTVVYTTKRGFELRDYGNGKKRYVPVKGKTLAVKTGGSTGSSKGGSKLVAKAKPDKSKVDALCREAIASKWPHTTAVSVANAFKAKFGKRLFDRLGGYDEFKSEAELGLVKAAQTWTPERASWKTYQQKYVRWHLQHWIANQTHPKRQLPLADLPPDGVPAVEQEPSEPQFDLKLLPGLLKKLDKRHRQIVERRFLKGHSLAQIATDLGISKARVSQLEKAAIRTMQAPENRLSRIATRLRAKAIAKHSDSTTGKLDYATTAADDSERGSGDRPPDGDMWLDPADQGNIGTDDDKAQTGDFLAEVTDPLAGNHQDQPGGYDIANMGPPQRDDVSEFDDQVDVAGSHADAAKAQRLLNASEQQGIRVLSEITTDAVKRLANAGPDGLGAAGRLYNDYELKRLAKALSHTIGTAELLGQARVHTLAQRAEQRGDVEQFSDEPAFDSFADVPFAPLAPEAAVKYFASLVPGMPPTDAIGFGNMVRQKSFHLAATTAQEVLGKVKTAILKRLQDGKDFRGAPKEIAEILDDAGCSMANPGYGELVFRTNLMQSLNHGSHQAMRDPAIASIFPAWQYLGILDGRQRPSHQIHFGKLYPSSVPFAEVRDWKDGRFSGYCCRCVTRPVSKYELARLEAAGQHVEHWPPSASRQFSEQPAEPKVTRERFVRDDNGLIIERITEVES